MLLPTLLLLCALSYQMVSSHSPAGLRALATLHTQRSRAIANALNLRVRAQYSTAIARARASNLGLYDHRFIRGSDKLLGGNINTDFEPDEEFPFHDINGAGDGFEDYLMRQTNFENEVGDGAEDFTLQQRGAPQVSSEEFIEGQHREFNENTGDILQIPLNFDESSMNPVYGDGVTTNLNDHNVEDIEDSETDAAILRPPQEVNYVTDNRQIYSNPKEEFVFTHTCSGHGMEAVSSETEYQNLNSAEQISTMQPSFTTYPATLDRQGYLENSADRDVMGGNAKDLLEPQIRTQQNVPQPDSEGYDGRKSADPSFHRRLRPHGHTFTHIHSHFHGVQPLQPNVQTPTAQAATPGINLNVIQNQNAAVSSQFATTATQPGFNTATVNSAPLLHTSTGYGTSYIGPSQTNTGVSQAQSIQAHSFPVMPSTQQFSHDLGGNIGHSSSVSQSQNIQSHSASMIPNTQQFVSNLGGNAGHRSDIGQSQNIQTHSSSMMPNTQQFVHDLGGSTGHSSGVSQSQNIQSHSSSMMPNTQQFVNNLGGSTSHSSSISQSQNIQSHSSSMMPNTQEFMHNAGHSNGISQSQSIQTHSVPVVTNNQQLLVAPNMGSNTFTQAQTIHQGVRASEPVDKTNVTEGHAPTMQMGNVREKQVYFSDSKSAPQETLDESTLEQGSHADEKVGTFLNTAPMYIPEYHFDPNQPENRQDIVKYIEGEQNSIRRFLHKIENNRYTPEHQFNNGPVYLHKSQGFEQPFYNDRPHAEYENVYEIDRNAGTDETNGQNEKVGTINMGRMELDPLPRNLEELEYNLRRHWETEEQTVQDILDQIDQNYRTNMDTFSSLINADHGHLHDPIHSQNYHNGDSKENIHIQEVVIPDDKPQKPKSPHHLYDPTHFQNYHDGDSKEHIQIQEVDIPYDKPQKSKSPHHLYDPTHFQNYHDGDSKEHIQIQEVDIPDDKSEKPERPYQLEEDGNESQEDTIRSEMFRKSLEHDPELQKTVDKNPQQDRLGYIIQIPERRYSEGYQRQARSPNKTVKLDELLLGEKKVFNDLIKDAEEDEDLKMIGYIGDSLIEDMENRVNKSRRGKRQTGRIRDLPLHRLVTDPKTKFDMSKTLGNLGAATRNVFEHERAPLYHVRNMVGAAQDAVLATMKIPTKNFLIPSAYDIVYTQGDNDKVAAVNPSIFSRSGGENLRDNGPIEGIMNTFQRVGSAIRGGVMSGQEVLTHVGDVANHAKSAIHSTKHTTPRVVWKKIPAITREPRKKAVLITPRIFDISEENNQVESTLGKMHPDFIKVGHILDAVGVSDPNYNNVEFDKITIENRNSFSDINSAEKPIIKRPSSFKNLLESIKIIQMKNADDEDFVGNTLNSLNKAKATVGANSLKDFIVKMRHEFRDMLRNGTSGKNIYRNAKIRKTYKKLKKLDQNRTFPVNSVNNPLGTTQKIRTRGGNNHQNIDETQPGRQQNHIKNNVADNRVDLDQETVGASLLPEEIRHPFLGQASATQRRQFMRENNYNNIGTPQYINHREKDRDLGQILGAINPLMFERIFNETLHVKNGNETPHSMFHHHHNGHSHGHHHTEDINDEETLGTSMTVKGQITKPFMGHASNRLKQDFFSKYMPEEEKQENEDEENCTDDTESEYLPETPQWVDIFHPFHEGSVEYDE